MLKVFIGDITNDLADFVRKVDSSAYLCTDTNYNDVHSGTVYTSLADLSINNFISIIEAADKVYFVPPSKWSSTALQDQTYIHLNFLNNKKKIIGFNSKQYSPEYLSLADTRKTNDRQVWIIGCSFAKGIGVNETERYGYLISQQLGLPVSFLTKDGSSVPWAADQILRSDIRKNDIVIWGITGSGRFTFADEENNLHHICLNSYNSNNQEFTYLINKNFLTSNQMCYNSITCIAQVIKYLDHIGTKYILGMFPLNIEEHELKLLKYISQFNNSVLLYTDRKFIDFGNDNVHPGVLQHQWYAKTIIDFYQNKFNDNLL